MSNFRDTLEAELQRSESQSLAPTPLRPGVSTTLAEIRNSSVQDAASAASKPAAGPTNDPHPNHDEGMEAFLQNRRMKGRATSDDDKILSAKLLDAKNATAKNNGASLDVTDKSLITANRDVAASSDEKLAMTRQHRQTSAGSVDLLAAAAVIHSSATKGLRPGKNDSDLLSDDEDNDGGGHQKNDRETVTNSIDNDQERKKKEWMKHIKELRDRNQSNLASEAGKSSTVKPASGSATNTADWEAIKFKIGNKAQTLQPGKNEDDLLDDDDSGDEVVKATKNSKKALKRTREPSQELFSLDRKYTKRKVGKFKRKMGTTELLGINECPRPVLHGDRTSLHSAEVGATLGKTKGKDGPTGLQDIDDNIVDEHSLASFNVSRGVSFSRGISLVRGFSRGVDGIPLKETMLDRGYSLALSEVSLDRGVSSSINVFENEGQFDDASEEDEEPKTTDLGREMTSGTIGTFTNSVNVKRESSI